MASMVGQFSRLGIQLLSTVILARLLTPEEFGVMAMVWAITGIGELFRDLGLSTAAIQAKTLSIQERDNLWWVNTGFGVLMCLVAIAASPLVALFFRQPQVATVTVAMAFTFVLSGMATQYVASLMREMRFGATVVTDVLAALIGLGVAIVAALSGLGVWALVLQMLVAQALGLVALVYWTKWIPGWYRRDVSVRPFLNVGLPLFGSQIINYLSSNLDSILIGRFYGSETLGLYSRALQVARLPINRLRNPISNVAVSALAKHQRDDAALIRFAQRGQIMVGYPILLLAGGMAAAATPLVDLMLGHQWAAIVPFFALAAIGEGLNTLAMVAGWIYVSKGATKSLMRYTWLSAATRVSLLILGFLFLGPVGAAAAYAVAPVVLWPISLMWAGRATQTDTHQLLVTSYRVFGVVAACTLATGLAGLQVAGWSTILQLAIAAVVHLGVAGSLAVIPAVRRDYLAIVRGLSVSRG